MKPYVALEASAGSGKTFALAVRYVALILLGNSPKKILAITFTRKAAKEMKDRIVGIFCELNLDSRKSERLEISKILGKNESEVIALRDKIYEKFLQDELKIFTFDAFFGMILRQFSLNLGLMPDFEMSDSQISHQKSYFIDEISKNKNALQSFANYVIANDYKYGEIFQGLEFFYHNIKDLPSQNSTTFPSYEPILSKFKEFSDYVRTKYTNVNLLKNFNATTLKEIFGKNIIIDFDKKYFNEPKNDPRFMSFRNELIELCKSYFMELERYKISELYMFLELFDKAKMRYCKDKNILTFDDASIFANRLLSDIDKEILYFRLDEKITHILIDEFQDTNVIQYEILYPLIEEAVAGYGQNGLSSFFYVGDVKQSIYRFRGSKKELFGKLLDDFKQIVPDSLHKNYRSSRLIVDFVNQTFIDKIDNYKPQIPDASYDGFVRVAEFEDLEESILEQLNFLLNSGINPCNIAILCWKNSDVLRICEILSKAGINSVSDSSNLLYNAKQVAIVLEYLKFALFGDKIYLQNLKSLLNFEPKKIKLKIDNNIAEILKFITKFLGLKPCVNLAKLYEISMKFDNIFDFVFATENDTTKSVLDEKTGVNVLTVHKSKGLEFKHIIVLDMLSKPRYNTDLFLYEYDTQANKWEIGLRDKTMVKLGIQSSQKLHDKIDKLDTEDNINKIYVALTRGRNSLIILMNKNPNGNKPSFFKSFGNDYKYLNLEPFEMGSLVLDEKKEDELVQKDELCEFVKISKQEIEKKAEPNLLNLDAIYFGKALHYALELVNFKSPNLDLIKNSLINHYQIYIGQSGIDDILSRLKLIFECDDFMNIVKNGEILKEQDVVLNGKINRFDLLAINENSASIIDYKSSIFMGEEHKKQVIGYGEILGNLYPNLSINCYLCYVLKDKVEFVSI